MKQYQRLLMRDMKSVRDVVDSVSPKRAITISDDIEANDPMGDLMKFIDNQTKIPPQVSDPDSEDGVDVDESLPSYECEKCDKTFRRMTILKVHVKTFHTIIKTRTKESSLKFEDESLF